MTAPRFEHDTGVSYLDLRCEAAELGDEVLDAIRRTIAGAHFVLGPELEAFEAEFAAYCGAAHCVGVDSGTSAIALSLRALDIGPGDEVVTQPNTFFATVAAIVSLGARPVFADLVSPSYAMDAAAVRAAFTARTRAVIPVHMFGQPADLPALREVCARAGVAIVEDASQAHGAAIDGRRVGSGDSSATCFSFYPSKNLGGYGEGGAIVTNDADVARRLRSLRSHGSPEKFVHEEYGFNARLHELQAAILRVKLPRLDGWNERRRAVAARYDAFLHDVERPEIESRFLPSRHVYPVFVERRDDVRARLAAVGVETNIHYPTACHLQPAARDLGYARGDFPNAEFVAASELSLPIAPWLDERSIERVSDALVGARSFLAGEA